MSGAFFVIQNQILTGFLIKHLEEIIKKHDLHYYGDCQSTLAVEIKYQNDSLFK